MKTIQLISIVFLHCAVALIFPNPNVVCYYDSHSYFRKGIGFMDVDSLKPALDHCTHLIYGYATLNPTNYTIELTDPSADGSLHMNVTKLKLDRPPLKVLLSIGGNTNRTDFEKYLRLLETRERRTRFVDHAVEYLTSHGFDGLDLAWPFPVIEPANHNNNGFKLSSIFSKLKQFVTSGTTTKKPDAKEALYRDGFTNLVSYMRPLFDEKFLMFTVTQLPNVNASAYFYVPTIRFYVDFVNLMAFDFYTPTRYPMSINSPSPLYATEGMRPFENINYIVRYWIDNGMPAEKLLVAIATFARTWKSKVILSNVPLKGPYEATGPGDVGAYTQEPGLLAKYEYCVLIKTTSVSGANRFMYETEETIATKVGYVVNQSLGGFVVCDLSLDDFRGICTESNRTYPVLNAIVSEVNKLKN